MRRESWYKSAALRQRCQAGLNKSEQRHALAQVICTFKQGRIADRGQDAQQFQATIVMLEVRDAELFGFRALVAQMCLAQILVLGTLRAIDAAGPLR